MLFEWDEDKAESNLRKHGVSFQEARTVLRDPLSVTISDPRTHDESRFIDIGQSASGRLLVVVYTERESRIRIISSRPAGQQERKSYEEGP
ncbi:MAG TPA: BrnT family toxin [Thermoanaerobaculia bacterium]|jgi:hypothetical protein